MGICRPMQVFQQEDHATPIKSRQIARPARHAPTPSMRIIENNSHLYYCAGLIATQRTWSPFHVVLASPQARLGHAATCPRVRGTVPAAGPDRAHGVRGRADLRARTARLRAERVQVGHGDRRAGHPAAGNGGDRPHLRRPAAPVRRRADRARRPRGPARQPGHHEHALQRQHHHRQAHGRPAGHHAGRCAEQGCVGTLHRPDRRRDGLLLHPRLPRRRRQPERGGVRRRLRCRAQLPRLSGVRGARRSHQGAGRAALRHVAQQRRGRGGQHRAQARAAARPDPLHGNLRLRPAAGRPHRPEPALRPRAGVRHPLQRRGPPGQDPARPPALAHRHRRAVARLPGRPPARLARRHHAARSGGCAHAPLPAGRRRGHAFGGGWASQRLAAVGLVEIERTVGAGACGIRRLRPRHRVRRRGRLADPHRPAVGPDPDPPRRGGQHPVDAGLLQVPGQPPERRRRRARASTPARSGTPWRCRPAPITIASPRPATWARRSCRTSMRR